MEAREVRGLAAATLGLAAACARPAPRSHTLEIRDFAYLPATLEVAAGDTVVWINRDVVPHTVTGGGAFHPTMRGILTVR